MAALPEPEWVGDATVDFRLIVIVDGERTIQEIVPFDLVPRPGEVIELHSGRPIIVRHVIEKQRHGLAGIILAWPA